MKFVSDVEQWVHRYVDSVTERLRAHEEERDGASDACDKRLEDQRLRIRASNTVELAKEKFKSAQELATANNEAAAKLNQRVAELEEKHASDLRAQINIYEGTKQGKDEKLAMVHANLVTAEQMHEEMLSMISDERAKWNEVLDWVKRNSSSLLNAATISMESDRSVIEWLMRLADRRLTRPPRSAETAGSGSAQPQGAPSDFRQADKQHEQQTAKRPRLNPQLSLSATGSATLPGSFQRRLSSVTQLTEQPGERFRTQYLQPPGDRSSTATQFGQPRQPTSALATSRSDHALSLEGYGVSTSIGRHSVHESAPVQRGSGAPRGSTAPRGASSGSSRHDKGGEGDTESGKGKNGDGDGDTT